MGSGDADDVEASSESFLVASKRFTYATTHVDAIHGTTHPFGDTDSEPRMGELVRPDVHDEYVVGRATPCGVDAREVRLSFDVFTWSESFAGHVGVRFCWVSHLFARRVQLVRFSPGRGKPS